MKTNLEPKKELQVLLAIEDLGEATDKEINEYLQKEGKIKIETKEMNRYLRRLKAKKVITASVLEDGIAWKVADIPFPAKSDMARVKAKLTTMSPKEANELLDGWLKKAADTPKLPNTNKYRDFHRFELTFEAIDPILGDRPDGADASGQFPKKPNGDLFIPTSWWKGWFRSNLYVINIPEAVAKFRLGYVSYKIDNGKKVNLTTTKAMTEKGPKKYDTLPIGTLLKMVIKYPLVGTPIRTAVQFQKFLEQQAKEPQRGFGANPFYYGGRLKLVDFQDKGAVASGIVS